jgi:hypothetical protein
MSRTLKTRYAALLDALRILFGRPDLKQPSGTGGAIG